MTAIDHRILFINKLKKQKVVNIWFKKANKQIEGLYDIEVQTFSDPKDPPQLIRRIRKIFAKHRSIGEDLNKVIILKPEFIEIHAAVDIDESVLPERVVGDILFKLNNYFNPMPSNESFQDLIKAGMNYDEIFELPSFKHGFMRNLGSDYRKKFPLSEVSATIETIAGVIGVRNLTVKKNGIMVTGSHITIENGHVPDIVIAPEKKQITIYKNHNRIAYDPYIVTQHYNEKTEEGNKSHTFIPAVFPKMDQSTNKHITDYTSVQDTFPIVYGIGKFGLPGNAGKERIRQARQLQSYLMLFDQIMINHLAQLKNLPKLFSHEQIDPKDRTYFTTLPGGNKKVAGFENLVSTDLSEERLKELVNDNFLERKNRLLDHLLARFSESFDDLKSTDLSTSYGIAENDDPNHTLASLKSSLLKQYESLSKNRNRGYNYTSSNPAEGYVFKTRLSLLLNISEENKGSISLTDHYKFGRSASQKENKDEKRSLRFKLASHPEVLDYLVFYGALEDSYRIIRPDPEVENYALTFETPKEKILLAEYTSAQMAQADVNTLIDKFSTLNKKAEGFHIIEHILLRPLLHKQYEIRLEINNEYIFTSAFSDRLEEQKEALIDAIICGTNLDGYVVNKEGDGYWIFVIDKKKNLLLLLEKEFTSRKDANTFKEKLIPHFKRLLNDKKTIPDGASFNKIDEPVRVDNNPGVRKSEPSKKQTESISPKEFDGAKITLLFPKWIPRFKDPGFQNMLMTGLYKCLPAHLIPNIIWLDLKKMAAFEKLYKQWLDQKSETEKNRSSDIEESGDRKVKRAQRRTFREEIIRLDNLSDQLMRSILSNVERQ